MTNGSLLHLPEVRQAACEANVVKISLSVWDQTSYEQVNRPHPNLRFDQLIEGQFNMHLNTVSKYLGKLMRTHQIRAEHINTDVYYTAVDAK